MPALTDRICPRRGHPPLYALRECANSAQSLCEVVHTCWKATLLGGGGKAVGEEEMTNVATALVESSAAETLLVVIVAMAMAVVLGALLVQRFDPS